MQICLGAFGQECSPRAVVARGSHSRRSHKPYWRGETIPQSLNCNAIAASKRGHSCQFACWSVRVLGGLVCKSSVARFDPNGASSVYCDAARRPRAQGKQGLRLCCNKTHSKLPALAGRGSLKRRSCAHSLRPPSGDRLGRFPPRRRCEDRLEKSSTRFCASAAWPSRSLGKGRSQSAISRPGGRG